MSVNPNNIQVTVPGSAPRVQLPNGNTVAVVIVQESTPIGQLDELIIAESAAGTSTFYSNSGDAGALPDSGSDPYQILADMLISSGMDPATMGQDQVGFVKSWLPQQTYQTAYTALFRAVAKLVQKLQSDLAVVYPPTAAGPPAPSTNAPKDPNDLLNWILANHVQLSVDPVTGAVTAALVG